MASPQSDELSAFGSDAGNPQTEPKTVSMSGSERSPGLIERDQEELAALQRKRERLERGERERKEREKERSA